MLTRFTGYEGEAEVLGKLRRVQYHSDGRLDVHGLTMEEANGVLQAAATGKVATFTFQGDQVVVGLHPTTSPPVGSSTPATPPHAVEPLPVQPGAAFVPPPPHGTPGGPFGQAADAPSNPSTGEPPAEDAAAVKPKDWLTETAAGKDAAKLDAIRIVMEETGCSRPDAERALKATRWDHVKAVEKIGPKPAPKADDAPPAAAPSAPAPAAPTPAEAPPAPEVAPQAAPVVVEPAESAPPAAPAAPQDAESRMLSDLQTAHRLKDVINVLETYGVKGADALVSKCEALKKQVPALLRVSDIPGRVRHTLDCLADDKG
jgi:NACalpha-BTF3-like transcription factor